MLVVMLSFVLSASDSDDVAGLVKRAQAMAARADPSWTDAQYNAYSEVVAAWRKEAAAVQARPTLKKRDAIALLNARVLVAERYRSILSTVPVPKSMAMLGDQMVAAWRDSIEKWMRSLAAEAAALKEEAKQRARAP
ncbi:MAG: hypothetical protein Q8N26_16665 [Myxococcales bacterium]|nr:hypothetical protein [Myxococcales bacterium]